MSELKKLGTGAPVDLDKLHEEMDEDKMDRALGNIAKLPELTPEENAALRSPGVSLANIAELPDFGPRPDWFGPVKK